MSHRGSSCCPSRSLASWSRCASRATRSAGCCSRRRSSFSSRRSGELRAPALPPGLHRGLPAPPVGASLAAVWVMLVVLLPLPIASSPKPPLSALALVVWAYLAAGAIFRRAGHVGRPHRGPRQPHAPRLHGRAGVDLARRRRRVRAVLAWLPSPGRLLPGLRLPAWSSASAADGEHRQQLKWLLAAGSVRSPAASRGSSLRQQQLVLRRRGPSASSASPRSRSRSGSASSYRLYEIDRLISRTLSYADPDRAPRRRVPRVVVLATDVLPFSSPVGVAASTLAAAALFNPLRRASSSSSTAASTAPATTPRRSSPRSRAAARRRRPRHDPPRAPARGDRRRAARARLTFDHATGRALRRMTADVDPVSSVGWASAGE